MAVTEVPFTDLLSAIVDNRGRTAPTSDAGIALIATNCITEDGLYPVFEKVRYIDDETYRSWFRGHPLPGDIIFVCKGAPGRVALTPDPVTFCIAQDMVAVRPDPGRVYPPYLFAVLRSSVIRNRIDNMHVGTMIPHFKKGDFKNLPVPLVENEAQVLIGDLYFELSDKIESNRRASDLIEKLLLAAFQGLLTNNDFKEVSLAVITTSTKGVSYKSVDLLPSTTSLVTLKSIDRTGGYKSDGLKPYVGPYKPAQVTRPGELVVAQTDLTQGAEVVGRAVRVPPEDSAVTLVASLDLTIVRPNPDIPPEYLLGVLTDERFRHHCRSRTSGTTVLHLASDAIPTYPAPLVTTKVREEFASRTRPLIERKDGLASETRSLTALRDALLPELLSGRIRVPEACEAVEAAQ